MSQANMSINPFAQLGRATLSLLQGFGKATLFLIHSVVHMFSRPWQWRRVIEQLYFIGAKSIVVICVTGLFTGMVLGLQGYYTLSKFGSTGLLGSAVALTLIRELGPVLTAIMIIGRAGSAMTAEIGIMRISEQIDALKTMTIDPIRFLVSPRIIAALISFPLLTAIFDTVGIFGGYLTGSQLLGINPATYFYRVESSVIMADVAGGFIKSIFFSITVITVCCYHGYYTHIRRDNFGAKGVGLSTTTAVVQASILVLVIDYILTTFLL
ncbi:MAG: ABC transporter permease [Moritella sp.]|uniref:MlaE family ABC transporter permease n=1 Tax=Moritella sp. TaxID=78556 RepID=UPI0025E16FCF|nr:MlaE family lipid ABC transporter permease subunit [Moritella sp.]NQZ92579.1 ABC transporter permease [Moritella sp.]